MLDMRWGRLVLEYLRERMTRRELGRETMVHHRSVLMRFVTDIDGQLDRNHVMVWLDRNEALAAGTLRTNMGMVRRFTHWCYLEGHLASDPMVEFTLPKVPRMVPRALDIEELQALWQVLPDDRARLIIALGVGLGLRVAEIAGLQVGDWDRYNQLVTVRHQSKGGHQRVLPVPDHVAACIRTYLRTSGGGAGPLLRSESNPNQGLSAQRVGKLTSRWMTQAGVKHSPGDGKSTHALRHSFAQMLYQQGGDQDLRLVQAALGHSCLASTEVYMRSYVDTERLRRALNNVDLAGDLPPAA